VSLFIWIIFIILGVFVTSPWCAIYGNEIDYPSIIGLTSVVLAGSLVSMAWCRYVCPLGGLFSLLSRFCQYIIKGTSKLSNSYKDTCPMSAINDEGQVDTENCIYCLKCTERHGFKITKIISILIFSTFLYSSSLLADDWTTFGKDSKHTSSTSVNFNSPDLKNTWTFEPSQHIWNYEKTSYQKGMNVWSTSCATLEIDNKIIIYAGFYNHNLYAIDAETGEYIWRYATGGKLNSSPCAKEVGDRAMVFIGSSDRIVYAIDGKSGKKIWSYETEKWNYTASNGNPSSPIIEEIDGKNTLFICFWNNNFSPFKNIQKGEVFSFDAVTGELIWRIKLSDQPLNSPSFTYIDNKPMIFITSYDGNLYSVDAKTGLKLWNFTSDAAMHSSPTIIKLKEKDYVVFGTRFGNIYALDAVSGSVLWKFKTGHAVDSTCAFSVIEDRSIVFVGSHDRNLYAIDASDGKKIWSFQTENFITSSPAIGSTNNKPTIFVSSLDDYLYAIDVESGQKVWQYKTGPLIWEYATRGDTLWSSPVLLDTKNSPLLIFGSYDGKLYAFSSKSTGENRATEQ
jgi:outer membrane protein assembly factor BamB